MGQAGGYYGDNNRDGDLTQIVYDRNGTVSGTAQSSMYDLITCS